MLCNLQIIFKNLLPCLIQQRTSQSKTTPGCSTWLSSVLTSNYLTRRQVLSATNVIAYCRMLTRLVPGMERVTKIILILAIGSATSVKKEKKMLPIFSLGGGKQDFATKKCKLCRFVTVGYSYISLQRSSLFKRVRKFTPNFLFF